MVPLPKKLLTVAGSDSGGAAGLQADLRVWARLGVYGMCAITAVTAQDSTAVHGVHFLPSDFVTAQIRAVCADYGAEGVKSGFLGRAELVEAVAHTLAAFAPPHLVVDPVLVNHQGAAMFAPEVTQAYLDHLLPLAQVVTPNCAEAALLTGQEVHCLADAETAVRRIHDYGAQTVLIKRIPAGGRLVDLLFDGQTSHRLPTPKIDTANTHGSGDTLSAALCAFLAMGDDVLTAVTKAQQFTAQAIANGAAWQMGAGHGPVWPTLGGKLFPE